MPEFCAFPFQTLLHHLACFRQDEPYEPFDSDKFTQTTRLLSLYLMLAVVKNNYISFMEL